jgi:protein O-mannosyl-transferase
MLPDANKFISRKSICAVTIVILALQYGPFLNFNFVEADYTRLYMAKYYFSLYNVFVDQFLNSFFYRPLSNGLLYKLFYDLSGLNTAGYRSFILLVFFLNTLLVYELTLLLCHEKYMAWSAALFFVTRTALAQEVLCLSCGFEDPVATFFILSSFVAYLLYAKNHAIGFYIAALVSAILGILSRESAMVIPLIILLIEYSCLKCFNIRHVTKALIRVIPFSLVAACPFIRMIMDTLFFRAAFVARAGWYGIGFSLHSFLANLYFFFLHSFNSSFEMYCVVIFLVVAFGGMRHAAEKKRQLAYACGIIFIGFMPYISVSNGLSAYYLSISLIGISVLFALGIKNIVERFPVVRSALIVSLVPFFVVSCIIGIKTAKELDVTFMCEKISSQAIELFKREFPTLPEESFVYIENSDHNNSNIRWALQDSKALRFIYNNTVSVYFEGVSNRKTLPVHCSGIYVFSFKNNQLHFEKYIAGADLQGFLKEKRL